MVKRVIVEQDPWLTVEESAEILQMSIETVRRRIRQGDFRTGRSGRRHMIRRSEIDRYIESGGLPPASGDAA